MIYIISIVLVSVAYAVKGGQLAHIKLFEEGKLISTILVSLLTFFSIFLLNVEENIINALVISVLIGAGWIIGVSPSIGEEVGAVGSYKRGGWGEYVTYFDRDYGIKKSIQRGAWTGVFLTIFTGFTGFIVAGLLFPLVYWTGHSLEDFIDKYKNIDGWEVSEYIYGGILGIAFGYYIDNASYYLEINTFLNIMRSLGNG